MTRMKELVCLCLLGIMIHSAPSRAEERTKKSGHIWGYQFMDSPSPAQFDKLSPHDKVVLLSSLYSCFPVERLECPGSQKIVDEMKKYEASLEHGLRSLTPEDRLTPPRHSFLLGVATCAIVSKWSKYAGPQIQAKAGCQNVRRVTNN